MPMMDDFNGSSCLPDNYGFLANQPPPPSGSSTSSQSISLHAISPNLLRTGQAHSTVSVLFFG